jgi:hypothetical protein
VVLGSSAITMSGSFGDRHRGHAPLALAARQLMRIGAEPVLGEV